MSLIEHRHDMIAERYFAPSERAASLIDHMREPPYRWRMWLRRLYVLTWPLSLVTRVTTLVALAVAWLILSFVGYIAARLAYIWHGERSPWE